MPWIIQNSDPTNGKVVFIYQGPEAENYRKIIVDPFDRYTVSCYNESNDTSSCKSLPLPRKSNLTEPNESEPLHKYLADENSSFFKRMQPRKRQPKINSFDDLITELAQEEPTVEDNRALFKEVFDDLKTLDQVFGNLIDQKQSDAALTLAKSFQQEQKKEYDESSTIRFDPLVTLGNCLLQRKHYHEALDVFNAVPFDFGTYYDSNRHQTSAKVYQNARKGINAIFLAQHKASELAKQTQQICEQAKTEHGYTDQEIAIIWQNLANACRDNKLPRFRIIALEHIISLKELPEKYRLDCNKELANCYFDIAMGGVIPTENKLESKAVNALSSLDETEITQVDDKEKFKFLEMAYTQAIYGQDTHLANYIFHSMADRGKGPLTEETFIPEDILKRDPHRGINLASNERTNKPLIIELEKTKVELTRTKAELDAATKRNAELEARVAALESNTALPKHTSRLGSH